MAASSANGVIELLEKLLKILKEEQVFDQTSDRPIIQFLYSEDLQKEISFSLDNEPASDEQIKDVIRQIIRQSVKTSSRHFYNKFYGSFDEYGLVGSCLTEVLNTSIDTYENAPVFTLMEKKVIQASLKLMGYPIRGEGIMTPGGNISIMYAMMLARKNVLDQVKTKGLYGNVPLVCLTSDCGDNYSVMTAAQWLGIGTENVYTVKTDKFGRMDMKDLTKVLNKVKMQQKIPFFMNATAGTPMFGAIDPLREIYDNCLKWKMWLHVDARISGTLMFSKCSRYKLRGIERFVIILEKKKQQLYNSTSM